MAELTVSEAQHGQRLAADVGDTIVVNLHEPGSGGYRWSMAQLDDRLLDVETSGFVPSKGAVGAGGHAVWTLTARGPGDARVELKRWRPWEGERSVQERFHIDVHIRRAGS